MNKRSWFTTIASFTGLALAALACGGGTLATSMPATAAPLMPATAASPMPASATAAPVTVAPSPTRISPGEYNNSMTFGGETRDYILHVPPDYDGSKAVPLVFMMHAYEGSAAEIEKVSGINQNADKDNVIVVYPNGTGNPTAWNALFFPPRASQPDDVGFITALLDKLEQDLRIDSQRIYVGGFSNGAMMSYYLGAELSNRLAAIAIVEGALGIKQADGSNLMIPNPARPVSVIAIHGRKDPTVPYNGGRGIFRLNFLSVAKAIGFWTKRDGCSGTPQITTSQNGNVVKDDYSVCQQGSEVVLITIGNGTHDWPTAAMPNQISATDAIWEFFMRHPKP